MRKMGFKDKKDKKQKKERSKEEQDEKDANRANKEKKIAEGLLNKCRRHATSKFCFLWSSL